MMQGVGSREWLHDANGACAQVSFSWKVFVLLFAVLGTFCGGCWTDDLVVLLRLNAEWKPE